MKLEEINHTTIADVPDQELLSLHRRVHQLWTLADTEEEDAMKVLAEEDLEKVMTDEPCFAREVIMALEAVENFESEDDSDVDTDQNV